ncbi:MAG: NAD(P)-binding protein, partial [Anaerolineae bacterium]
MTKGSERRWDTAIVGAGPAGMAAAIALAERKVRAIVLDSAPLPGGQYFKQTPLPRPETT